jgi:hypothetical protein
MGMSTFSHCFHILGQASQRSVSSGTGSVGFPRGGSALACAHTGRNVRQCRGPDFEALGCVCRAIIHGSSRALSCQARAAPDSSRYDVAKRTSCSAHERLEGTGASAATDPPKQACAGGSRAVEGGSCCSGDTACKKTLSWNNTLTAKVSASDTVNVEMGGFVFEHVIVSISGMTCTGCKTML